MTTGLPNLEVLLDDGTGTWATDITDLVNLTTGWSTTAGRTDEFSQAQAAQLQLVLDNADGYATSTFAWTGTANQSASTATTGSAVRTNLEIDPGFESGSLAPSGGNYGTSNIWSFDTTRWLSGTHSLKLATGAGTGDLGAMLPRATLTNVQAGDPYTFSVYVRRAAGSGDVRLRLEWLDNTVAFISATVSSVQTLPSGVWTRISVTGNAPSGTVYGRATIYYVGGTYTSSDVLNADQAMLEAGSTVGTYFDGSTVALVPDDTLVRLTESYPAPSTLNLVPDESASFEGGTVGAWTAGGSVAPTLSNSTAEATDGTHSLLITWGTGGTFPQAALNVDGLTIGQTYTAAVDVIVPSGSPGVQVFFGGTGGQSSRSNDARQRISATFTATATSHSIQLLATSSPTAGELCYVDRVMVNLGSTPADFNKRSTYDLLTNAGFEDRASVSTGWSTTGSGITLSDQTGTKHEGSHSLQAVGTTAGGDTYISQTLDCLPSQVYTLRAWRYVASITAGAIGNRSLFYSDDAGTSGGTFTLSSGATTGTWVLDTLTLTTGANATTVNVRLYVPQGTVYWDEVELIGPIVSTRFTGRVSALGLGWPGGGEEYATVGVTAVDKLADLARRPMRSLLEEELLLRSDLVFLYPMSEEQGTTTAGDVTPNGNPVLQAAGSGAAPEFGGSTSSIDGLNGVTFNGHKRMQPASTLSAAALGTVGCIFTTAAASTGEMLLETNDGAVVLTNSGFVRLLGVGGTTETTSLTAYDDQVEHMLVFTSDLFNDPTLYIDGGLAATTSSFSNEPTTLHAVGGDDGSYGGSYIPFSGVISMVFGLSTVLTSTEVAELYGLRVGGLESTEDRLSRICAYVGETPTTIDGSGQLMPPQATSGRNLIDALEDVAAAEGGVLFADGEGTLTLQGRYYRTVKDVPDATLGEQEPGADTAVTWDTQQKFNQVTVTRTGGAQQVVQAAALTADRNKPVYPATLDVAVDTDDHAVDAANWLLAKHTDTTPRLASVTFNLLASPQVGDLLRLRIGDRISLTAMPSQLWPAAGDYTIEGIAEAQSTTAWTLTFTLLPWSLFEGLVLDSPTEGLLDTGVLGY